MIENTNTKQFYPGPILNDTLEISEFLFNTAEQIKIKHSKFDETGVLRDVDLVYGQDYEVLKDEALTCDDGSEPPSHAHIMEMGLTASTGQITLKEHIHVIAGERLTAYRESAIIQDKNYPRTGAFPAATHEGALDYLTMQNQEQQDELDRALKVPISTQNFAGSMPLPIPGRALKINQDGSGFEMSEFDPDIALTTTENFRNEAQQFATEASQSALAAKNSEMIAGQRVNDITALHSNYMDDINTTSTNYLNQINSRGNTIIKDADAIINRVGLNMFDTVVKDHILTYEESKGLALQGTYVYKNAVAGSRYGYPDFYNKCLEEYQNESNMPFGIPWTQPTLTANGTMGGNSFAVEASSQYDDTVPAWKAFDGTSTSNWVATLGVIPSWITFYNPVALNVTKLAILNRATDNDGVITTGEIQVSNNNSDWVTIKTFSNSVVGNTTAWEIDLSNNTGFYKYYRINGTSFVRNYISIGEVTIQATSKIGVKNPNGHIFYDIADKQLVDDIFNSTGMAWMYGIDQENERVFLPRNNWFDQATGDVSEVGQSVEAGLPNITGTIQASKGLSRDGLLGAGAFSTSGSALMSNTLDKYYDANIITLDASRSNPIYGNSGTVQPNAVKKLLYICVGNTVADTSWVDVVTQVKEGTKDIQEAKDEAIDELKNITGGTVPLGFIGFSALGIDETLNLQRYLNGQIILQDQFKGFTKFLKRRIELYPSLACTEDEWQTTITMSAFSQCGKFVIDDNAGTIRLPKVVNIQGLTDLSKLGEIVEAGLPNHKHHEFSDQNNGTSSDNKYTQQLESGMQVTSMWYSGYAAYVLARTNSPANVGLSSNPIDQTIYGNSDTVQQEQIQYPYFIQVATGSEVEDNIINEIELNNPYSLLDVKWSDKLLNNISWLRSEGQSNSRAIYNDVYDLILREYNSGTDETETVGGVSITFRRGSETNIKVTTNKSAYDSILSATGTAWYYVIDATNETFYLPQSDGFLQFGGNGDFVEAGLPNITGKTGYNFQESRASGAFSSSNVTQSNAIFANTANNTAQFFDASLSNPIYGNSDTVQPNAVKGYLYFYVGETVQNANLINAGRIEEKMHSLISDNSSLISGYGMPDYSAGVSKSINVNYIEATNGFLVIDYTNVNTYSEFQITINGTSFNFYQGYSGTDYNHCNVGFIPIPKNTTYKITLGVNIRARYFPCIGG